MWLAVDSVTSPARDQSPERVRARPMAVPLHGKSNGLEVDLVAHDATRSQPAAHFRVHSRQVGWKLQHGLREDEIYSAAFDHARFPRSNIGERPASARASRRIVN